MILHGNQTKRTYAVTFETEIFAENDPYEDCQNYPTQFFLSYEECDKEVFFILVFFISTEIMFQRNLSPKN